MNTTVLDKLINYINSSSRSLLLSVLIGIAILTHLPFSNYPPVGYHTWRQTQGLSIARNYYDESMNFFEPRVDSRGSETGITGVEFPILYYFMAVGYKIFGFNNFVPRILTMVFSFLAVAYGFLFFEKFFKSRFVGFFAGYFILFSPLFVYYSFVAMPEIPSLGFTFLSLYYLMKWKEEGLTKDLIISSAALSLAGLLKISSLIVLPFILFILYKRKEKFFPFLILGIALSFTGIWYLYARYLSHTYHNYDFLLTWRFPYPLDMAIKAFKKVFVVWLPEVYLNYGTFAIFLAGIYFAFKHGKLDVYNKVFFITNGVGITVFAFMMVPMLNDHDYYMIPSIPLLIYFAALGMLFIEKKIIKKELPKFNSYAVIFLIVIIPIVGSVRGLSRFVTGIRGYSDDYKNIEQVLDKQIPDRSALIIACNDDSPSILLYRLHRKGWSAVETITVDKINEMRSKGAKYIVSDSRLFENRVEIKNQIDSIASYGEFKIFAFK